MDFIISDLLYYLIHNHYRDVHTPPHRLPVLRLFEKQKKAELAAGLIAELREKCQENSETIANIEDQLYEKNIEIDKYVVVIVVVRGDIVIRS